MLAVAASAQEPPTVRIGSQVWMKYNLSTLTFRDGDSIPLIREGEEWAISGKYGIPACTPYKGQESNTRQYGLLYNYAAVTDPRGLCPAGFRVPKNKDWAKLEDYLGKDSAARALKATMGWEGNGNGNNSSGFNALPGGFRSEKGVFFLEQRVGYWWTLEEEKNKPTVTAILVFDYDPKIFRIEYAKEKGMSVRCLRDE